MALWKRQIINPPILTTRGSVSGDPDQAAAITSVPFKAELELVSWEGGCVAVSRKETGPLAEQIANHKSP